MHYRKRKGLFLLVLSLLFFLLFTQKSDGTEQSNAESKVAGKETIVFDVRRENQKFVLENLEIEQDFGLVASVTLALPEGVVLNMVVPEGWVSYNQSTDSVVNYLLTANNTPADVHKVLGTLNLLIKDEDKAQGKLSISLSGEKISSWQDPQGNAHYYKFVNKIMPWLDAYNAAKKEKYKGLTGYLATITSLEEHDYIFNSIARNPGWLGGTRIVRSSGSMIMDQATTSNNIDTYNLTKDNWYWVGGPEAGKVFFIGKNKITGQFPSDSYDGWRENEPNNGGAAGEYVLQFAVGQTKWWNDLGNANINSEFNQGYFVEFSAYGNQVEIEENSYSASLPQLVKIKYLEKLNNQSIATEEIIGTVFSMDDTYDATPLEKNIKGYQLVEKPKNVQGTYSEEPTTLIFYYEKQQLTLHIQQVILNNDNQLVVPSKGYAVVKNVNAEKPEEVTEILSEVNLFSKTVLGNTEEYETTKIWINPQIGYYQLEARIPEYYEYVGYKNVIDVVPPLSEESDIQEGVPIIDANLENATLEYWIKLYIQPSSEIFKPYSWSYR